jgi:type IV secretory pathway VirB9-like protein
MLWAFGSRPLSGGRNWRVLLLLGSLWGCATTLTPPVLLDPPTSELPAPTVTREPPTQVAELLLNDRMTGQSTPTLKMIQQANREALRVSSRFHGARLEYDYCADCIYQIDNAVGYPTTLKFTPGEVMQGWSGPKHNSEEADWEIKDMLVGEGLDTATHLAITAKEPGLRYGMVVSTYHAANRQAFSYSLELVSHPYQKRAMTTVSWKLPLPVERPKAVTAQVFSLGYEAQAVDAEPAWMPLFVWASERQFFVRLPESVSSSDAPLPYAQGKNGALNLLNWRKPGKTMIIDQVPAVLELRLDADPVQVVQIRPGSRYRSISCPGSPECGTIELSE